MIRKILIVLLPLILLTLFFIPAFVIAAAPTMLTIDGSTSFERGRLEHIERSLNFTKVAMPDTWDIHIIPKEQFDENVRLMKLDTLSAYTYGAIDQTYISEEYLTYADNSTVRQTLAHEAGHMICQCTSESKANDIAWQLQQ